MVFLWFSYAYGFPMISLAPAGIRQVTLGPHGTGLRVPRVAPVSKMQGLALVHLEPGIERSTTAMGIMDGRY